MPHTLKRVLHEVERAELNKALTTNGTVKQAAQNLGISTRTMYYKLRKHGLSKR